MREKNRDELRSMHWRDRYSYEVGRQAESLSKLREEELIARVERKGLDPYFQVWRAIARKGTVENSAMVLWRYLQENPGKRNMLNRYHCAAALFEILGMPDPSSQSELRKRVQWDSQGEEARQEALLELKQIIESKLQKA